MPNYDKWDRKKISVTTLHLDPLNPRLPSSKQNLTQNEIIAELIRHDNVLTLAQRIAGNGYFSFEPLVVIKEKFGTVVVEGNRRLAALKLLINPDLASGADVRKFKALADKMSTDIKKVEVVVAPNRAQAYSFIRSRHIGDGAVEKWTPIQQARFYADRLSRGTPIELIAQEDNVNESEVIDLLRADKLYALARSIELPEKVREKVDDPRRFPITTLTRLADSPDFRKALGIEHDRDEIFRIKLAPDEFVKGLKRVVSDIVTGDVNSRKHNTNSQIRTYVESLGSDQPNKRKKGNVTADELIAGGGATIRKKKKKVTKKKTTRTPGRSVLPRELKCNVDDDRICEMFKELKGLPVATYPNAVAILLRSILELSCYRYLTDRRLISVIKARAAKKGQNLPRGWTPKLQEMLKFFQSEKSIPLDGNAQKAITYLVSDKKSVLSLAGMNGFVHNNYMTPTERELRALVTKLRPILDITLTPVARVEKS